MIHEQLAGDRAAHRVSKEVSALDLQMVHESEHIADHLLAVLIISSRLAALPMAAAVECNRVVARLFEPVHQAGCFDVSRVGPGEPMNEDDRRAASLLGVLNLHAIG